MREVDMLGETLVQRLLLTPEPSECSLMQSSQHAMGYTLASQCLSPSTSQVF